MPLKEMFWERVSKTSTCWNWIGSKTIAGYGHLGKTRTKKGIYALTATLCNFLTNLKLGMEIREVPFHQKFYSASLTYGTN